MSYSARIVVSLLLLGSCNQAPIENTLDPGRPDLPGLLVIRVTPAEVALDVGEAPPAQRFEAVGQFEDGRVEPITDKVVWSMSPTQLGYLKEGSTMVAAGLGGQAQVVARSGEISGRAVVRLRAVRRVVEGDAPGEASFAGGEDGQAPQVVYPYDQVLMPPNLGAAEIQWRRPAAQGAFEVALRSATTDVRIYTRCKALGAGGCGQALGRKLWDVVSYSNLGSEGEPLVLTVRGLNEAQRTVGQSAPMRLRFASEEIRGGIYYWTSVSGADGGSGIYRIDMERGLVEAFYTQDSSPLNHRGERGCVGCHALARGGDKLTMVLGGGHISDLVQIDVSRRSSTLEKIDRDAGKAGLDRQFSNFQSYGPDGQSFVSALRGKLRLLSSRAGEELVPQIDTGGLATHPDWSRSGALLAYTRFADAPPSPLSPDGDSFELSVRKGAIGLSSWNGSAFSQPRALSPWRAGRSSYYPSLSPDERHVAFNRVECPVKEEDCSAYDNPRARIFLAPSAGGAEVELAAANRRGPTDAQDTLTNSWPKFGPFLQKTASGRTLLWITFSSKRNYGLRVVDQGRPQLWMAAVVISPEGVAADPSLPPFWIPNQDIQTSNHIAQWTEQVVPLVQ